MRVKSLIYFLMQCSVLARFRPTSDLFPMFLMYLKIESGINIVLHKQCMLLKVLILWFYSVLRLKLRTLKVTFLIEL